MSKLFDRGLENRGLVSYHNIPARIDNLQAAHRWYPDSVPFSFLHTLPHKRQNADMPLRSGHNRDLVAAFQATVPNWCNFTDNTDIQDKGQSMHFRNSCVNQAFVYVALETAVIYPQPYVSTISFKGVAEKRPFLIYGVPGVLAHLRDLGFQTFGAWWNEGYDSQPDPEQRAEDILNIVREISDLSDHQRLAMLAEMSSVLEHNYHHLRTTLLDRYQEDFHRILAQQFL
jgi:hypothetical protein